MELNGLMTMENEHASEELGREMELASSHSHNGAGSMIWRPRRSVSLEY